MLPFKHKINFGQIGCREQAPDTAVLPFKHKVNFKLLAGNRSDACSSALHPSTACKPRAHASYAYTSFDEGPPPAVAANNRAVPSL